tara:strand:+ start:1591 stop:2268 length:678 start_codon:yes stop_codon:yes gene_type:complete
MTNIIELNNISKSYYKKNDIKVLKKINLKFEKGKTYSITGPSGSGKSTLLNLISLIDKPTSGSIKIENELIKYNEKINNDKIRAEKIGIIYQDKNLLTDFTALENVYLARLTSKNNLSDAIKESKKIINKLGLGNRINHYPSELSGGEAQRIAISRALINSPQIILADEPTGSLDNQNARDVFKILLNLKSTNRTIIFATHNRFFSDMADCKIELNNGKISIINA